MYVFCTGFLSALCCRRDPFAVSSTTFQNLCQSRIPFACFRPILRAEKGGQKRASKKCKTQPNLSKPHKMNTCEKSSHNSCVMNTYIKVARGAAAANVFFAANVIPMNALRSVKEVIRRFAASTQSRVRGRHTIRARSNRRRRYNSFAFILLCDAHKELPRNQTLTKKGGGVGGAGPDPFAITTDRAMIDIA